MSTVLVVYANTEHPMRGAAEQHLRAFGRHSSHECVYFNIVRPRLPRWLSRMKFDAIVFHTSALGVRWSPWDWHRMVERLDKLSLEAPTVLAYPQDEFYRTKDVAEFVQRFGVTHVFSVAPAHEWPKLYPGVDTARVSFDQVLTGYLDDEFVARAAAAMQRLPERSIDVGYRAWGPPAWLGRQGQEKIEIAERFVAAGFDGLRVDVATDHGSILIGDDWLEFLVRCRAVLGTESGASLDFDGTLRPRVDQYVAEHPGATFEQIERACFPGTDGNLDLRVSPRHLEACATRTCQVLIRGDYSGVLQPDLHYIPLEPDYRNADEVAALLRFPDHCRQVADRAHADIVESGRWSYRGFVHATLDHVVEHSSAPTRSRARWLATHDDSIWRRRLATRWWCARRLSGLSGVLGKRVPADAIASVPLKVSHRLRGWPRTDASSPPA